MQLGNEEVGQGAHANALTGTTATTNKKLTIAKSLKLKSLSFT